MIYIRITFNTHKTHELGIINCIYQVKKKVRLKNFKHLPKVIQLVHNRAGMKTYVPLIQNLLSCCLPGKILPRCLPMNLATFHSGILPLTSLHPSVTP